MTVFTHFAQSLRQAAPSIGRGVGLLAIAALFVASFVPAVSAKLDNGMHVRVPFGFTVGRKQLPEGDYSVERRGSNVLIFRKADGSANAIVTTSPIDVDRTGQAALVFHKYAATYYLAQVRSLDGTVDYKVLSSQEDRQLAKASGEPHVVVLNLNSR
jgi:hypothetical protein